MPFLSIFSLTKPNLKLRFRPDSAMKKGTFYSKTYYVIDNVGFSIIT
jgi:hypothetical protein